MAGGEIQLMSENENKPTEDEAEKEEEALQADDDVEEESDSNDSADDAETDKRLTELESQVKENPFMYAGHVELISALREAGELERLRAARETMSTIFPLSEDLWLAWLKDEISMASGESAEQRAVVERLFERAVQDYLSVPVWLEYVQFSIGGMGHEGGIQRVRDVFERALTAAGLHVTKGAMIWEAYREFEAAVLAGLMPAAGSVPTKEQEEKFTKQNQRVISLFKRQLSVPLNDMEETYSEFRQWMSDIEVDQKTAAAYNKARDKLKKIQPFEDALLSAPGLESYQSYIQFELKENDPARIQCLFERALQQHCLQPDLWIQYTQYLDRKLRVKQIVMAVYKRAVRNCPWSAALWEKYLVAMERYGEPWAEIRETLEQALQSGLTEPGDFLLLWTAYCDYLKRRIDWDKDHAVELEDFRNTIQRAVEHLAEYFGSAGDPRCSLKQFWAFVEARFCKNMEKARELWGSVMAEGHGNEAVMWLEYLKLERLFGDTKHCRKLLQRALNSASDWPESIVEAFLNFEREEGTFETYDQAVIKCEAQMERVSERRAVAAEKEALMEDSKKSVKPGKKDIKAKQNQKLSHKSTREETGGQKMKVKPTRQSQKGMPSEQSEIPELKPYKRKLDGSGDTAGSGSKMSSSTVSEAMAPPDGEPPVKKVKGPGEAITTQGVRVSVFMCIPGPGEAVATEAVCVSVFMCIPGPSEAIARQAACVNVFMCIPGAGEAIATQAVPHDASKEHRTVFISNLLYSIDEERLREIFSQCGEITEVRLPKNFKGKSKGFGYVEFRTEDSVSAALRMDRKDVEGRPMYVSPSIDRSKQPATFRFSTDLEKNKLFVRGLPFTCSKEALENIFGQHGKLRSVRLVTHKSGAPKGLAYIEFENETEAAQAVLKTDGLQIGDHTISVAISNPPDRRAPLKTRAETFVPSLGGGKKESEIRGKARTQLSLVPRAVQKKPPPGYTPAPKTNAPDAQSKDRQNGAGQTTAKDQTIPSQKMSNSDFRNMLLKK
ncbi:squamous cell carcinoma antigen recognized by T-cells 3-like [Liolophura sinensis]|uniref:squamous cell carcinoma antigen recognized by T-cells 3-like n=1 Tax=Liolophura sinensis TaxID=3198878 RepID=UPI003158735E